MKRNLFILVLLIASFFLGWVLQSVISEQKEISDEKKIISIAQNEQKLINRFNVLSHEKDSFEIVEIRKKGYQFISPLLDCYNITTPGLYTMKDLENKLKEYITSAKERQLAHHISVYYRDLSNGPWLGIDEEAAYAPASLLKLPNLIAAYKYAEQHPNYLTRTVKYKKPAYLPQEIITGDLIIPGNTYTVQDLLERMIIYSDNQATYLINQTLPQTIKDEVYEDLAIDISYDTKPDPNDFMSVKEYAGFFRVLYNASYLNKNMSHQALLTLSKSAYKNGIVAGLPANIIVSHKFGERSLHPNIKQLHDCGIIYMHNHPYILCVMTRGKDFVKLEEVISTISKIIYDTLNTET